MRFAAGFALRLLLLLGLAALPGCGDSGEYAVVPVSGIVTCQGKPVANANVNFSPKASEERSALNPGKLALGMTDAQGHFQLTTYENNDGAIIGTHTVTVSLNFDESTGKEPRGFPCKNSQLEITIDKSVSDLKVDFK